MPVDWLPKTKILSADEPRWPPGRGGDFLARVRRLKDPPTRRGDFLVRFKRLGGRELSLSWKVWLGSRCCRCFSAAWRSTRSNWAIIRCTRKYLAHLSGSLRSLLVIQHIHYIGSQGSAWTLQITADHSLTYVQFTPTTPTRLNCRRLSPTIILCRVVSSVRTHDATQLNTWVELIWVASAS